MPCPPVLHPEPQTAGAVLMVRPAHFRGNPETLASNRFQLQGESTAEIAAAAQREFDALATGLAAAGVRVHAFAGRRDASLPDEVFPNNWVSFHADGTAVLYPMLAPSRRAERRPELIAALRRQGYRVDRVVDLTALEHRALYLEGTGSVVLDRPRRVAYACLSPRTSPAALETFGRELRYEIEAFDAVDRGGAPIYHTNVLLSLGSSAALLCADAVADPGRRDEIVRRLRDSGREIIELSFEQLHAFAGNALELASPSGPVIALSGGAYRALREGQRQTLAKRARLVAADIPTIERWGGGSVRCMLAEMALPRA